MACFCATSSVEIGINMWSVRDLDHESMKSFIKFDKAQNKDKMHRHKVLQEAQTLALVGIYINLRRQDIAFFYF